MSRKLNLVALAVMTACSTSAQAFDFDPSTFSFNGFGTIGSVHSSEDQADFVGSAFQTRGAGYTNNWSYDVDTLLGLQASARITDKLSAVVQVVAQQRNDNTYSPEIEWANIKYAITPDFSIRAGRIAMPTYLASDTRNVRYAQTTVRPSIEVYRLLPITNSDGVDVSYTMKFGSVSNTVQVIYGENSTNIIPNPTEFLGTVYGPSDGDAKGVWGVFDTLEIGDLKLHAAYQGQQLEFTGFLEVLVPQTQPVNVMELGFNYDPGNWFVTGEFADIDWKYNVANSDQSAFYVTGGVRVGEFTPYISLSTLDTKAASSFNAGAEQDSAIIGVRYDFMSNFDLKLEYQYIDLADGSSGTLTNVQPGFEAGGDLNVFSVAVDFVF